MQLILVVGAHVEVPLESADKGFLLVDLKSLHANADDAEAANSKALYPGHIIDQVLFMSRLPTIEHMLFDRALVEAYMALRATSGVHFELLEKLQAT